MLLKVEKLKVAYGVVTAVRDIDLHILAGELVCLIGANGAGKTTVLNTLAGMLKPVAGRFFIVIKPSPDLPRMIYYGRESRWFPKGVVFSHA